MESFRRAGSVIWLIPAVRLTRTKVTTTAAALLTRVFVTIALAGFLTAARAGEVFRDDFSSPDGSLLGTTADVGGTWSQTGSNSTNPIQTSAGASRLQGIGQDAYAPFSSSVSAGGDFDLKTSLDLNVTAAQPAGDYFFHLSDPVGTTTNFYQRLMVKSAGSGTGYLLGLTDPTNPFVTWGSMEIPFNSSHRVDVVWHFVPGGSTNDAFTLSLDGNSYLTHHWSSTIGEPSQVSAVNFRQGNSAATVPTVSVDNLTITTIERELPAFSIFEWKYVNPADHAQGKQPSTVMADDGFGVQAGPGLNATALNLNRAFLVGANLTNASFNSATLTRAALEHAILTGADLTGSNLTGANLSNANLTDAIVKNAKLSSTHVTLDQLYSTASYKEHDLSGVQLVGNNLSGAYFAGQVLAEASFYAAKLTDADFTNANLTNAELVNSDLAGANLTGANFTYGTVALANLSGANLKNANFSGANMIGANFSGADIRGAGLSKIISYGGGSDGRPCGCGLPWWPIPQPTPTYQIIGSGITLAQLVTTASYVAHDLAGTGLMNNNFNGGNFAGFNLTNTNFYGTTLAGADFSRADARGSSGLEGITAPNFIRSDGHVAGLNLGAGQTLSVRDYYAPPTTSAISITVDQQLTMAPDATLRMMFDADPWDSTISFAPGIPVSLSGTLQLALAAGVDPLSQIGRTIHIFDWTGVSHTGTFAVDSPYLWDVSSLYTTGNITFLAVGSAAVASLEPAIPEPAAGWLFCTGLATALTLRRARLNPALFAVLALLTVPASFSIAASPDIQLTQIGAPIWKPVDFQLFSAPATPFAQSAAHIFDTILPNDDFNAYTPHSGPYETELSTGAMAGGYVTRSLFTPDAITLNPNGVYFMYMLVPQPGVTGDSRDFESGPVIPNSLFPLLNNVDVWLDGVLVDHAPGADAVINVQQRDIDNVGMSHLEVMQAVWHPWDDDLAIGPLGRYDLRTSMRDASGSGWDVVVPFRVALPGDYDYSGTVGPEDYRVWKANFGSTANLDADGNDDHIVDAADYTLWRDNLVAASGAGAALSSSVLSPAIPEPQTILLLSLGVVGPLILRRRFA